LQKQDTLNKTGKTKTKTKQTKKIDAPPKKKLTYKQQQELTQQLKGYFYSFVDYSSALHLS
jgi:hypothetical protein